MTSPDADPRAGVRRVTSADRMRDAIALAVLIGGAALYLYGYTGLRALADHPIAVPKGEWAMARYNTYHQYSNLGILLVGLGVLGVVWSFSRHRRGAGHAE